MYLCDFYSQFQYHSLGTEEAKQKYWSRDKLHLSEEGYDRMGEIIYESILAHKLIE